MLKHPMIRLAILGIALLGFSSTFYFMAPLFVAELATGGYPTLAYLPTYTPLPPSPTTQPTEPAQAMQGTLIAEGSFYQVAYQGKGVAAVYQAEDGQRVLHLDDFEVQDGPDLHVYLVEEDAIEELNAMDMVGAVDLGVLQASSGEQSYLIPAGLELGDFALVLIWCVPEETPYTAAQLDLLAAQQDTPPP